MKTLVSAKNNLISLLDKTFPGANDYFDSPMRDDGHQKWVDFVAYFTGPQLIAELGDVRRFANRGAIVAFVGVDPEVNESGSQKRESNPITKRGSSHLRKTLYQVVSTYLKQSPKEEPVYQFLDKKRTEGKPYFVYMAAAANKFLRIYHARVKFSGLLRWLVCRVLFSLTRLFIVTFWRMLCCKSV